MFEFPAPWITNPTLALAIASAASALFLEFPHVKKKKDEKWVETVEPVSAAPATQGQKQEQEPEGKYKEKMEQYYHKIRLYELLINKYADYIERNESKTVQDLKAAVQPQNPRVVQLCDTIREKSTSTDPVGLCEQAYDYVANEIDSVAHIGVSFWLSIEDMLDSKVADYEDKAILLCSVFRGFGVAARVVISELSDGSNRPLVFLRIGRDIILCDPNQKHDFNAYQGARDEVLTKYRLGGERLSKLLYEFNDKEYIRHEG